MKAEGTLGFKEKINLRIIAEQKDGMSSILEDAYFTRKRKPCIERDPENTSSDAVHISETQSGMSIISTNASRIISTPKRFSNPPLETVHKKHTQGDSERLK